MFLQLPGFSFGFGPASSCRSPEGVCSLPRQNRVKGAAASGALAHSGQGEGGVQRRRGEPAAAEAGVKLQQPEARRVFSRRSCPWITGPWQWRAAQAPGRGGVESDLCSHTGFLVAAAAALGSPARLWVRADNHSSRPSLGSALISAARARLWSSFRRRSESPLLARRETKRQEKVSCLFGSCRLFPGLPPG